MAEAEKAPSKKGGEGVKYMATEDCIFGSRYLCRGDVIILTEEPNHRCLVKYTERMDRRKDAKMLDPVQDTIEHRRIMAAMSSFRK